jgi:hypothetical protein
MLWGGKTPSNAVPQKYAFFNAGLFLCGICHETVGHHYMFACIDKHVPSRTPFLGFTILHIHVPLRLFIWEACEQRLGREVCVPPLFPNHALLFPAGIE